ncbi:MAG: hypothetical protein AAF363_00190 [Bacteroidota bacterium]
MRGKFFLISTLLILFVSLSASAQIPIIPIDGGDASISGPSSGNVNSTYTYNLFSSDYIYSTSWSASGGTITSSSKTSATVRWTSSGSRSISATVSTTGGYYFPSLSVTVLGQLAGGSISGTKTICYGASAGTLTNSSSASGGTGTLYYQWQYSTNNSSWTNISGATGSSYSPGTLTSRRYYRRRAQRAGVTRYSNTVTITVRSDLSAGGIVMPGSQQYTQRKTICRNTSPGSFIIGSQPFGGDGNYSYQWQYSTNNSNWYNITNARSATYNPGNMTQSRYYRRRVQSCGQTKYTSVWEVRVRSTLNPGFMGNINYGGGLATVQACMGQATGDILEYTSASDGINDNLTYQWEKSTNNSSWVSISGATDRTYEPEVTSYYTTYLYYRRRVSNGCESKYSNTVYINRNVTITPGVINGTKTVLYGNSAGVLGNQNSADYGVGPISYQWQYSYNQSTWYDINNATGVTYNAGAIQSTRYYRRRASNYCGDVYSNLVTITVNINPGSIRAGATGDLEVCDYDYDPNTTISNYSTGNWITQLYYQWEKREEGGGWEPISGAEGTYYLNHLAGALTKTTEFRRKVYASGQNAYSNEVKITITPKPPTPSYYIYSTYIPDGSTYFYGYHSSSPGTLYFQTNPTSKSTSTPTTNKVIDQAGGYYYRLENNGCWSDANGYEVLASAIPDIPDVSLNSVTNSSITIDWNRVGNESGFRIYRSDFSNSGYSYLASVPYNITNYTDNTVTEGKQQFYRVQAVLNNISSDASSPVKASSASSISTYYNSDLNKAVVDRIVPGNTYQWVKNGSELVGMTDPFYTLPVTFSITDGDVYQCIVSNGSSTIYSSSTMTVNSSYWAVRDGDFNGNIWSTSSTGVPLGIVPPPGSNLFIRDKTVNITENTILGNVNLYSNGGKTDLLIDGSKMGVFGEVKLNKSGAQSEQEIDIKIINGGELEVH